MRTLLTIVWSVGLFLAAGCGRPATKFSLTVKLEQPKQSTDPLTLIIDLNNITTRTQTVIVPTTRFFWGSVSCRDSNGVSHVFIHTNILGWVTTVTVIDPFDLAPGASRQWRHPLTDFVEFTPGTNSLPSVYRFLGREFRPGGVLWCEFSIAQESIYKPTASLSSAKIGYPQSVPPNQTL